MCQVFPSSLIVLNLQEVSPARPPRAPMRARRCPSSCMAGVQTSGLAAQMPANGTRSRALGRIGGAGSATIVFAGALRDSGDTGRTVGKACETGLATAAAGTVSGSGKSIACGSAVAATVCPSAARIGSGVGSAGGSAAGVYKTASLGGLGSASLAGSGAAGMGSAGSSDMYVALGSATVSLMGSGDTIVRCG